MSVRRVLLTAVLLLPAACSDDDGGGGPADAGADAAGPAKRLVILHTNDEHSHLFGFAPEIDDHPAPTVAGTGAIHGGIARRAKALVAERAAAQAQDIDTLTISAGDETQGALPQIAYTEGAPDFTLMKRLGYDVMCPGNHEFDLGPGAYAAAITSAAANGGLPQIVSTNIHFDAASDADDSLAALFGEGTSDKPIKRYQVITTPSGIKVGFFGVMGIEASYYAPFKTPVTFSALPDKEGDAATQLPRLYADIEPTIAALRDTEKVDVVVMVSHGGVSTVDPTLGEDYQIAQHVAGIDVIISGHSHTPLAAPQVVTGPDGHDVPIVQAGSYGEWLGRIELIVQPGQRPTFDPDPAKTKLITIDDTIVADDATLLAELDGLIADLESVDGANGRSPLEDLWTRIEGAPVSDDPGMVGDLYFRSVGHTSFDVIGERKSKETNVLNLSTDAMLAAAETLVGPTAVAINASGSVRGDIKKGKTGAMTFADLYRIFPLGTNPVDGSIGYPLARFYLWRVELKAAFEIAASTGLVADSFFLSASGMRVEFDTSRPAWDSGSPLNANNGRVTKITVDTNHADGVDDPTEVLFDVSASDPWMGDAFALFPVVTSVYVASFAGAAGAALKDAAGEPVTMADAILHRGDGTDVKEVESFIGYVRDQAASNGGELPDRYDENKPAGALPRRMICSGPLCP